jgi:DNA mismatch endonuclease, patch repair protein
LNSKNTKPEIKVQKILLEKGIYFLKHIKTLAGTPDIIIPSVKIILDIKGCFCHQHGCIHSKLPKSNQLFWIDKFEKIKIKDVQNLSMNKKKGWNTFEIWECLINDEDRLDQEINRILQISKKFLDIKITNKEISAPN